MHRKFSSTLLRRSAALTIGALALLTAPAGAQSPTGTSPNTPKAYSWPSFHAGRYEDPKTELNFAGQPNYISQLLGTPTGVFTVPATYPGRTVATDVWTQFPSFLLGNYDPAKPPGTFGAGPAYAVTDANTHNFRPNTFSQRNISYWLAPYAYADALNSTTTSDDSDVAPKFTVVTGPWTQVTPAPTATNNGYRSQPTTAAAADSQVTWQITVPTAGVYSIVAHIPFGVANVSTDAAYSITYTGLATPILVRRSQASGGTITLLSPVNLPTGAILAVTLDNSQNNSAPASVVVADSVSILNSSTDTQIVDEDNTKNTGTPFNIVPAAATANWVVATTATSTVAGSASNGQYLRTPAVSRAKALPAARSSATWQFNITQTGLFQASFHIPNSDILPAGDANKEYRITDAHYTVSVLHNNVSRTAVDVNLSQTEANGSTLIGAPVAAQAGDTVTVSLANDTANDMPSGENFYVVADSMTLSKTVGAVVDSSPVAVNATDYPEIKNAQYYGVLAGTISTPDIKPRGNTTLSTATPPVDTNIDPSHRIRQLVYFGRNETLYANNGATTIDDTKSTQYNETGTWASVSGNAVAATATNVEYHTTPIALTATPTATATWKIPVAAGGQYSIVAHLPLLAPNAASDVTYSVSYNDGTTTQNVTVSNKSQVAGGDIVLIPNVFISASMPVTVSIDNSPNTNAAGALVIADSVSLTTPAGRVGRVYCVDGLTGGVVWRYTLPPVDIAKSSVSTNTEIHSTPAIARFNVLTDPTTGATATKLCVVVSDDGGRVYCLDAVGNRDGNTIDPTAATLADPLLAPATPQVGTTNSYWIWRPDQNHVKVINPDGTQVVTLPQPEGVFNSAKDMFAPLAFQTASPTVYVDKNGAATIYIGNSNGVLYALDATGTPAYDTATGDDISPYLASARLLNGNGKLLQAATAKPLWWFSVSGSAAGGAGSAHIESAPVIDSSGTSPYRIYFGSSHELGGTSNYGRIYALDSTGPVKPANSSQPTVPPGTNGYNTSTSAWEFPRGRAIGNAKIRPALGSITGSPVVFKILGTGAAKIYFAANTGAEIPFGSLAAALPPPSRDSAGGTGRIWCIDPAATTATFDWAYPKAIDPNDESATSADSNAEPTNPIGGFLHATPALGMVEFPLEIQYNPTAPIDYTHSDANGDVKGSRVPMLYVGTAGTSDKAMYALDLNGTDDVSRAIYRLDAPNGSSFQSSPALITNANTVADTPPGKGGNGGMVYCTAGNILYQFSATPLSNNGKSADGTTYQQYARIGVDAIFGDCGPVSSPTLAAADISDISTGSVANTTDWLYVGDTTTGLTKGLTPSTQNFGFDPGTYIANPPPVDPGVDTPGVLSPTFTLHIHIFDNFISPHLATSTSMADENKIGEPLPTFEWGSNAYIRVSNIIPANPTNALALHVVDPDDNAYYFTNGSPVTLQIGDVGATTTANDNGLIPAINQLPAALPADGFYPRSDASLIDALKDTGANKWFGAYTYAIRDGSGRLNTPGSMRRVTLARQTAEVRAVSGDAIVGTVTLQSQIGNSGTDPTFGILNPLAIEGNAPSVYDRTAKVPDGVLGPNGPTSTTPALTNGNNIYSGTVPVNGYSLGGLDPTNPTAGTNVATYPTQYVKVATATGEINHGSSGTNLTTVNGALAGGLLVSDRSLLSGIGGLLRVRMEQSPLHWNDSTGLNGGLATINPLPWESMPVSYLAGANRSPDYPDIASNGVAETLQYLGASPQTNLTYGAGSVTEPGTRYAQSSILLTVHAPKYQPANLTGPTPAAPVADGYHTRVRIFVDSNQNGQWDLGEAYRDVDLQSGVLADLSTSIVQNTTDIGIVPQGFGLNTDAYAPLGSFIPPGVPFIAGSLPGPMTPSNYGQFFRPVTVHNDGNVNLVNAQFDQKVYAYPTPVSNIPFPSPPNTVTLLSESVDQSGGINAFDKLGVAGLTYAGKNKYLVRTSLDRDLVGVAQNPVLAGSYPGDTFHKARVGDVSPTKLEVPDRSPDDYSQVYSDPMISVAVPYGTPTGTYHQTLRLFEGMDPVGYNWLVGPTYNDRQHAGFQNDGIHVPIPSSSANIIDGFALLNTSNGPVAKYESVQPYSEPGTTVKVTVTEARLTGDKIFGELPMIDDALAPASGVNYLPSAFFDDYWRGGALYGSRTLNLIWTSTRAKSEPGSLVSANVYTRTLSAQSSAGAFHAFTPAGTSAWWRALGLYNGALFDDTTPYNAGTELGGLNVAMSVAQEPHVYDAANDQFSSSGNVYGFYSKLHGSGSDIYCGQLIQLNPGPGPGGGPGLILERPGRITTTGQVLPKYGVRGLKVPSNYAGSGIAFNPPAAQSTATKISEDLWAFWYTGARGESTIQYSATATNAGFLSPRQAWTNAATLPMPAGLTSVSDPSAILIPSNPPQIQVTYTGVSPDGNSDIYVSNYLPYRPYMADPTSSTGASIPDNTKLGLLLTPAPSISEYLQPDANNQWWQARDVAWLRSSLDSKSVGGGVFEVPINVNYKNLVTDTANSKPVFDTASGMLVYTALRLSPGFGPVYTAYIDLARGRIRFQPALPKGASIYATFQPLARRITTDKLAESGATAILDEAFKPNEDGIAGSRVSAARMWYLYSKTGGSGAGVKPSLYYKTQRLTIDLHDAVNKPISIALNTAGAPDITVTVAPSGPTLYDATTHLVDIDWKRGRINFPLTVGGVSTDGMAVDITYSYYDAGHVLHPNVPFPRTNVQWLDEARSVDLKAPSAESLSGATDSSERAVPIHTVVNEGNVSAFLDPTAYADVQKGAYNASGGAGIDQPHNIWLFWSSSRNGQGDLYSAVLNPKFSADTP